jgi:hypothetical protein
MRTPDVSAVDADAAMSPTLSEPTGSGAVGEPVESRLHASVSDNAAVVRHPMIARGSIAETLLIRATPSPSNTHGGPTFDGFAKREAGMKSSWGG